jgi:hypothetical protein
VLSLGITSIYSTTSFQLQCDQLSENYNQIVELYHDHKHSSQNQQSKLSILLQDLDKMNIFDNTHSRKNVLSIVTDDQGYADIGYNDPTFVTPTIDYISSKGIRFTSYYVQVYMQL